MNSKEIIKQAENSLQKEFEIIDEIRDFNQEKVLNAFIEHRVAPEHFYTVSGYGHDDIGREVLDKVFAEIFKLADIAGPLLAAQENENFRSQFFRLGIIFNRTLI